MFSLLAPYEEITHGVSSALALIFIAIPIISEAREHFSEGKFGMNELVLISMAACCAQFKYVDAAIIGIIMSLHEVIEHWTPSGSEKSLSGALELNKKEIIKITEQGDIKIQADQLNVGDHIKVAPGDLFVIDGKVISGEGIINNAAITGESIPVDISPGSDVRAGAINLSASLVIEVNARPENTMIAQMDKILSEAKETKSEFVSLVNKYSSPYAFFVLGACATVFYFTKDADRSISLLIVSFPDAFVMASPLAMLAAITSCARCGVLIKTPLSLLKIKDCDHLYMDKTGTITEDTLKVDGIHASEEFANDINDYSVSLAQKSRHPVSQAVASLEAEELYDVEKFQENHGLGISGYINGSLIQMGRLKWIREVTNEEIDVPEEFSIVAVAINNRFAGYFTLVDFVRNEAEQALENLKQLSPEIRVKMLSGDLGSRVKKIAGDLNVSFRGECLPADKADEIKNIPKNSKCLFIGDGLNDAPAMAVAEVGISMNTKGNELTSNHADLILLGNNLHCLPYLKELSQKTQAIITQNLICGAVFVLVGTLLAASELLPPMFAAVFHLLDAIFIVLNSARLIKVNVKKKEDPKTLKVEDEEEAPLDHVQYAH